MIMDKIDMLMTITISGFGLILSLMLIMWNGMNKMNDRITSIEHDLIEIKTILRFKECCMINDERKLTKVE